METFSRFLSLKKTVLLISLVSLQLIICFDGNAQNNGTKNYKKETEIFLHSQKDRIIKYLKDGKYVVEGNIDNNTIKRIIKKYIKGENISPYTIIERNFINIKKGTKSYKNNIVIKVKTEYKPTKCDIFSNKNLQLYLSANKKLNILYEKHGKELYKKREDKDIKYILKQILNNINNIYYESNNSQDIKIDINYIKSKIIQILNLHGYSVNIEYKIVNGKPCLIIKE